MALAVKEHKVKKEDIVKALPVASPIVSAAIARENSSGIGNLLSASGNLVSSLPGGEIYGAGLNIASGAFNALFGSDINEQAVQQYTDEASALSNKRFAASNTEDLLSQANFGLLGNIKKSDIGSEGLFSNAATNKANEINRLRQGANNQAQVNYGLAAESLDKNNDLIALNNSFAHGGPLTMRYTGTMSPFGNTFADGGKIYIKPENRGKFTALKERTGKSATWFKEHGTLAQKKMAIFALNARKWKHAFGGNLITNGAEWDNGLTIIGNGGTHEENPMEGVPMGMDAQGIPNLVEEGEVIFNDYVFSNRMFADGGLLERFNIPKSYDGHSFADIAKKLSKESSERPNDPISQRGLDIMLLRLQQAQEHKRMKKQNERKSKDKNLFAEGGPRGMSPIFYVDDEDSNDSIASTGTKIVGVPVSLNNGNYPIVSPSTNTINSKSNNSPSSQPQPNEGDFRKFYDNYSTNTYGKNPNTLNYSLTGKNNVIPSSMPSYTPVPDDNELLDVARVRLGEEPKGKVTPVLEPLINSSSNNNTNTNSNLSWPRYAPVVGDAIGLGQNIFSKPDYSSSDTVLDAANKVGSYTPVRFNSLSDYLTYRPFDINRYINKLNAQSSATRRAIINQSAGNGMAALAGLIAANHNALDSQGDLAIKAEEFNLGQEERRATFNRGTKQFNAEMGLKAAMANLEAQQKARSARLSGITQAMTMRDVVDARRGASMSANLTNLFDSLGNIGIDEINRADRDMLIRAGVFGTLSEKPQGWSNKRWEDYKRAISGNGYSRGGKLKKRRGGLTY